ncbi:MAG: TonB-dependent siderophore receptor [Thermoanaerobaculia bacterium]
MLRAGLPFRLPLFLLLAFATAALHATASDSAPATIRGTVEDSTGAPLAAARLSAAAVDRPGELVATSTSDPDGRYLLELPAGSFVIRTEVQGFADIVQRVEVLPGGGVSLNFVLQVATVQETITVSGPQVYVAPPVVSGTLTPTLLRDVPQSVTVVTRELMQDQLMTSIGDVVRYVPGIQLHQGENNRDQVIIRGNSSSADFFLDGLRDDVQYYRDLYNLERVEALKGPNALLFGRGGGGGVINRVSKEADFDAVRAFALQGGSYGNLRATADFGQALGESVALRLNGMYEEADSFRDGVDLERTGVAPSLTWRASEATKVTFGYEHFRDDRVADRGITSYRGKPADVPIETFYGNPDDSYVRARADLASAAVEHRAGDFVLRNRTLFGDYDRGYQNYVPGAVSPDKSRVTLTAYNNATQRRNLFNQTDAIYTGAIGPLRHTLLVGAELGQQRSDNFRNTGYFGNATTTLLVPYSRPTIDSPVTFRQSATDADNRVETRVGAIYAQDQVELAARLQLLVGVRLDRFEMNYHDNRTGRELERIDNLTSPRLGLVFKPATEVSLYGSYTTSFLPSSGDQFSSLTVITEQMEPERFDNYELGAKWNPSESLFLTAALYRLDRTHTRATDPNDPTRILQTGSQRTEGFELGANGRLTPRWSVAGGYSYQDAYVTSATAAARAGATVAQVPRHTASLWNDLHLRPEWGVALGVIYRSGMFATIDNSVTLPGFTRLDLGAYYSIRPGLRLQINVENLLDAGYWASADSNTNLSPGSPRAVRVAITAKL